MNKYQQFIKDTLNWARSNDIVKTQYEFARLVGLDAGTISSVLRERYSGKAAARIVEKWRESVDKDFEPVIEPYNQARKKTTTYWENFRRETARHMLPTAIAITDRSELDIEEMVKNSAPLAVALADELIKQLRDGAE